jgi:hypothetical protein
MVLKELEKLREKLYTSNIGRKGMDYGDGVWSVWNLPRI